MCLVQFPSVLNVSSLLLNSVGNKNYWLIKVIKSYN